MKAWWSLDSGQEPPQGTLPVAATCGICGLEATSAEITRRLACYPPEVGPAGERVPGSYEVIPRCVDIEACRRRLAKAHKPWPLTEHGEDPDRPRRSLPEPMQPTKAPAADGVPAELAEPAEEDRWF